MRGGPLPSVYEISEVFTLRISTGKEWLQAPKQVIQLNFQENLSDNLTH